MTIELKTMRTAAIAGFAMLIASPAYAFLGGVPGPNGAYTDQRTNACCVSDGGKSQMPGITGYGPSKQRLRMDSGGGGGGGKGSGNQGGLGKSPTNTPGFGGGDN